MIIEHIEPFVSSIMDVYSKMFDCKLTIGKPVCGDAVQKMRAVTAIVGLSGQIAGNVAISLDAEIGISLTEAMLGQRPESIDEDVIDAVGEMVNIVAGQAKGKLEAFELNLAIPTVIAGEGQRLKTAPHANSMRVPFTCDWGSLEMYVALAEAETANSEDALCATA